MPKLAKKENCTGCTACVAACPKGCITMQEQDTGFLAPVIELDSCISCGVCEQVCPVQGLREVPADEPKAYAAYSLNEELRLDSSSGGVFTEIARTVIARGGVVFGAAYNDCFEIVHSCVESEGELARLRGAKYAQSDLRGIFREVKARLDAGQEILFSGTPCQVGGLKAFLRKDYPNLLTVDIICHSVPSPLAWREYVGYRARRDNNGEYPIAVNLRSKKTGWSRYQYSNLFRYQNGSEHTVRSGESLYMKLFTGGYISRDCCGDCQFKGYSRVSDLTLGDFWGVWDIAPDMDDNQGTSVVLVQSQRGAECLRSISDRLKIKSVTLEEAGRQNPALIRSGELSDRRQAIMSRIREQGCDGLEDLLPTLTKPQKRGSRGIVGRILRKIGIS